MISFFNFAGLAFWLMGLGACTIGRGAAHDANGSMLILTGTLFVVGAAILDEMRKMRGADKIPEALLGPGDKRRAAKKE